MSTNENETVTGQTNETDYFEVSGGVIRLKEEYRGDGDEDQTQFAGNGDKLPLPDVLVIPKQIGNDVVTSLAPGMFYNNKRVKEIVLPDGITEIPAYFCAKATNLRAVNNTDRITTIGAYALGRTRIKEALFHNLENMGIFAFTDCGYLRGVDIGTVSVIPQFAFYNCVHLREVHWRGNEVSSASRVTICESAFRNTRSLRELPLLEHDVITVNNGAFFGSGIYTNLQADEQEDSSKCIGAKAFPTFDNTTDFWTGVSFTPCCNKIVTKLNQSNPKWAENPFLLEESQDFNTLYKEACAIFAVMHIHSAITGKYYVHPAEFVQELKDNGLSQFLYYDNWPGQFHNVAPMFEAMGYRTEVYGTASDLSKQDYKTLVDALAQGAYIYAQVSQYDYWKIVNDPNIGHAVVLYGINDFGEVRVLDSAVANEHFQKEGFEQGMDIYTYTMPIQNLVGPSSNFVIVYPDVFRAESLPCDLRTGVNVLKTVAPDGVEQYQEPILGCLTAYHLFSDAARVVEAWQPDDGSQRVVRFSKNSGKWGSWKSIGSAVSDNTISINSRPKDLFAGANVSMIADSDELAQLPEGETGYMTVYNLFPDADNVIEEWQPNGSTNKYVRYALNTGVWSDWYIVVPPFLYHK